MKTLFFGAIVTLLYMNAAYAGGATYRLQQRVEAKIYEDIQLKEAGIEVLHIDPKLEVGDMLRYPIDLMIFAQTRVISSHMNLKIKIGDQRGALRCIVSNHTDPEIQRVLVHTCQLINLDLPAGTTLNPKTNSLVFPSGNGVIADLQY